MKLPIEKTINLIRQLLEVYGFYTFFNNNNERKKFPKKYIESFIEDYDEFGVQHCLSKIEQHAALCHEKNFYGEPFYNRHQLYRQCYEHFIKDLSEEEIIYIENNLDSDIFLRELKKLKENSDATIIDFTKRLKRQ